MKKSIGLWLFDATGFWGGSADQTVDKLKETSGIKGLEGVELICPTHVTKDNISDIKLVCADNNLQVFSVNPNIWGDPDFAKGTFSSANPKTRRKAIDIGKQACDVAGEIGAKQMCLWPGQDGFDYPFQVDHKTIFEHELEGIKAIAEYAPQLNVGIEYKHHEPRGHIVMDTVTTALLLAEYSGLKNIGVYLDFGHVLLANENPGAAVIYAFINNRLFGVHINDNYGATDEDMTFTSINHIAALEFFYSLKEVDYTGIVSLDIAPRKEDPVDACNLCFENMDALLNVVDRIDMNALREAQNNHDAIAAQRIINKCLLRY